MGNVSGRVTLDGAPVEEVEVMFQPDGSKPPSKGRTDAEGRYQLGYKRGVEGALVGEHTVTFRSISPPRGSKKVPESYSTESTIRKEVKAGANEIDFELTTK